MTEILPGILVHTLKELKQKNHLLKWAKKVHVDIMDGKFVPNKTVSALTIKKAIPKNKMQVHLMAFKPHKYISAFARLGVKELIIHAEATKNASAMLEDIRLAGMKAGIALNPETKVEKCADALVHADIALVMTIHPGYSGQTMIKKTLRKIAEIKRINPTILVGVDGGVSMQTCKLIKADFAVATHAVTETENPEKAYKQLKNCF